MPQVIQFDPIRLSPAAQSLRVEVRQFIREEIERGTFAARQAPSTGGGFDPEFSRRVGAKGWIGMTWPKQYGGHERSFLERYVVNEEFRVANAPVGLHFTADRQSGPMLLKYANESIKQNIVPRITRGEVCFCIGMSEPNSGSDLFAANVRAVACDGGWRVKKHLVLLARRRLASNAFRSNSSRRSATQIEHARLAVSPRTA